MSHAINSECASLHGIAILSDRLPSPARGAILNELHAYLTTVLDREWPDMQRRNKSRTAAARFQLLWQTVETVNADPADTQIRGQLLSLLAAAHQSRETRLFQMTQSVPGLIWGLLIILASGLIGCMMVFAAEASISKAILVGVFTCSLTLALLTVRVLDFPFESALQLSSRDFNETLEKVDRLITTAELHGSRGPERSGLIAGGRWIRTLGPPLPRECRFFSPRRKAEVNYNGREKDRPFRQDQRFKSRFPPTGEILISLYRSGYTWFGSRPATNKEPALTSRRPGLCVRIGKTRRSFSTTSR